MSMFKNKKPEICKYLCFDTTVISETELIMYHTLRYHRYIQATMKDILEDIVVEKKYIFLSY